jgi:hypothetical protein
MKEYYVKHREDIIKKKSQPVECDVCGKTTTIDAYKKHIQSKYHELAVKLKNL